MPAKQVSCAARRLSVCRFAERSRSHRASTPTHGNLVLSSDAVYADTGYRSPRQSRRRGPANGDLQDTTRAGVRTCFQLPAALTTPANRASPSEVPAAPPAVTSTRSQSQTSSSQRSAAGVAADRPDRSSVWRAVGHSLCRRAARLVRTRSGGRRRQTLTSNPRSMSEATRPPRIPQFARGMSRPIALTPGCCASW